MNTGSTLTRVLGHALRSGIAGLGLLTALGATAAGVAKYNDAGELLIPADYRRWVFVGTPLTPNELNNGKAAFPEFHNVYMDPESFDHFAKTGAFRDGTMLIKELVSVGSKQAVSGKGYFMGEFLGLEATVKDAKRFAGEPGNWAYFSWTKPDHSGLKTSAAAFPTAACNACHQDAAAKDFVFSQYYPVLRAADPGN